MAKKVFRPGDLVRTASTSGPVGGLLIVDEMCNELVAVHHIPECGVGSFLRLPTRLCLLKHITLYITPEEVEDLKKAERFNFTKAQNSTLWDKAVMNNHYDVAILVNRARNVKFILEHPEFSDPYKDMIFKPRIRKITVTFSKKTQLPL